MLSLALALSLAVVSQPSPAELAAASLGDLVTRVSPERHRDTRYISLHAASAGKDRDVQYWALLFTLNSTSFRSALSQPPRVYGGTLVRLSLSGLGWDATARSARIERLKQQGVDVSTFKADLWEEILNGEPYFGVTTSYNGDVRRGWVDPDVDYQLRLKTYSTRAIVRADWIIAKLLREKEDSGVYSQALLLPSKESDLYKSLGIDAKLVDGDPALRSGGAVLDSIVALHNRELQLIPSMYGHDEKFLWRTFDFASDATGDKSVIETLAGKVKHDGREIIFTLPNGLHGGYLADGKGNQVNQVPQDIALDQRSGAFERIKDRSVKNFYSCVRCHGETNGVRPFDDVIGKMILAPDVGLAAISYSKGRVEQLDAELSDYYLSGLQGKIVRQQSSYAARVKATNSLDSTANALAINDAVENYVFGLVTPEDAAREMGIPLAAAKVQWRASGNSYCVLLSAGQPIRRAAWEQSFTDAMRATVYKWEEKH